MYLSDDWFLVVDRSSRTLEVRSRVEDAVLLLRAQDAARLLELAHGVERKTCFDFLSGDTLPKLIELGIVSTGSRPGRSQQIKIAKTNVRTLFIELTSKCNLTCDHCYGSFGNASSQELVIEKLDNLLIQASSCGVSRISITGGEPLLSPSLTHLIDLLYQNYMSYSLFSNLTVLTNDIRKKIREHKPLYITTSIESKYSYIHDSFRHKKGSHKATVSNIQKIQDMGIDVKVNLVIGKHNVASARDTISWLEAMGVKQVIVDTIRIGGRASQSLCATDSEIAELYASIDVESCGEHRTRPCGIGSDMIYISSTGKCCPCPWLSGAAFTHGDICDPTFCFESTANKIVERYSPLSQSTCREGCAFKARCTGGCPAAVLKRGENPLGADVDFCKRFRLNGL